MRNRWFGALAFAALLALTLSLAVTGQAAAEKQADPKTLFVETHKCSMCHSVASAGVAAKTSSEKMKGPDLSGYKSDKMFKEIAAFVRKTSSLDGNDHKKAFKGTDEELQAIIDWLGSLEAPK